MSRNAVPMRPQPRVFAGVDGCRGGWFGAWTAEGGEGRQGRKVGNIEERGPWRIGVFPHFAPLVAAVLGDARPDALRLLVDIPIGLPSGHAPRRCDVEARRLLGPRRGASVFPAPPRAVLGAGSWEDGLARARAASGRGISLQAWHLVPKIREVDAFLRADPSWVGRIREAHPELLFRSLALGGRTADSQASSAARTPARTPAMKSGEILASPDLPSKRTKAGFQARLAILEEAVPSVGAVVEEALSAHPRRVLARDDILDALVAATVAQLGGEVGLQAVPSQAERDGEGLPMEIVTGPGAPNRAPN